MQITTVNSENPMTIYFSKHHARKMTILPAMLVAMLLINHQANAKDRVVKCQVSEYQGSCLFTPDTPNGSFSLSNSDPNKPLTETINTVTVTIIEKGLAEVSGLTADGINSRWGEAKRSTKDKACWEGEDFKVCAW